MIENRRQYRITKREADRFREALERARSQAAEPDAGPAWLLKAQREALQSQLEDLDAEILDYRARARRDRPDLASIRSPNLLRVCAAGISGVVAYVLILGSAGSWAAPDRPGSLISLILCGYCPCILGVVLESIDVRGAPSETHDGPLPRPILHSEGSSLGLLLAPSTAAFLVARSGLGSIDPVNLTWMALTSGYFWARIGDSMAAAWKAPRTPKSP